MSAMLYIHTAEPLKMLLWRKRERERKGMKKEEFQDEEREGVRNEVVK